ncbi:MAG: hypothetical protein LBH46_00735 [Rickettsiales bacterium]|jgi:hypothetical protein|nr:hypothetical protein [Rickettsiales bacterium]
MIINNLVSLSKYMGISVNTLKNNYIKPLLKIGGETGIIVGGTKKKPSYIFIMEKFLKEIQCLNTILKASTKEVTSTTLTRRLKDKDTELQLEKLLLRRQ